MKASRSRSFFYCLPCGLLFENSYWSPSLRPWLVSPSRFRYLSFLRASGFWVSDGVIFPDSSVSFFT